jgi:hypothetical protein
MFLSLNADFFRNKEVIVLSFLPVDEANRYRFTARLTSYLHPVAKTGIERFVYRIQIIIGANRGYLAQLKQRFTNKAFGDFLFGQPFFEKLFFNIGVDLPVFPVSQVIESQRLLEQSYDALLGLPFFSHDSNISKKSLLSNAN